MTVDVYICLWITIDGDVYIVSVIKYFICTLHEVPIENPTQAREIAGSEYNKHVHTLLQRLANI